MTLDANPEAIFLESIAGQLLDCNAAACEIFGYSREEILKAKLADLIPESMALTLPLLTHSEISQEATGKRKDGTTFPLEVYSRLVTIDDERLALVHAHDISERKQLELTLRQSLSASKAFHDVAYHLLISPELQGKLRAIVDSTAEAIAAHQVSLALIDTQKRRITRFLIGGHGAKQLRQPTFLDLLHELDQLDPSELSTLTPDFPNSPQAFSTYVDGTRLDTRISMPVRYGQQTFGILSAINRPDQRAFSARDKDLLIIMANQAALCIENERLSEAEQQRAAQLDALHATVADIAAELELPKLLKAILMRATTLLNATGGDLGLYDEASQEIRIAVSYNMGKDYSGTRMQIGEGAMGLAIEKRKPVVVDNYMKWENASPQYTAGPWQAVLAVPFLIGKRLIGVIGIVDSHEERYFSATDQHLLSLFAQHAAIAVENAHLYQSAREAAEKRAILHQVSQQIVAASLDPEEIYAAIHNAAAHLMPAEAFAITRLDEAEGVIKAVYLVDNCGRVPLQTIPSGRGLSGRVIASGESIYIQDLLKDHEMDAVHFGDPQQVRSVLAVPMRLRGKVVGILSTQSYKPEAYNAEDQYLLEMLASYAAVAIDNASLLIHTQTLAITDPVTAIYNRRYLFEVGEKEFERARRFNHPLSVIMIDIDHFKKINDSCGHAAGDRVLHRLARFLQKQLRGIDLIGRYGGEEFTVILPETGIQQARDVANRLRKQVKLSFPAKANGITSLTISLGAAALTQDTPTFVALVERADAALYDAKNAGRNCVRAR